MDVVGLVAGIVSVVLGMAAILLSLKLYEMAESSSKTMREAEQKIQANVERLDRLFGLLYSDAFGLIRQTYTNMYERMWEDRTEQRTSTRALHRSTDGSDAAPDLHEDQARLTSRPGAAADLADAERAELRLGRLEDFLVEAYKRVAQLRPVVRAEELAQLAEEAGFSGSDALDALYDLLYVKKRLYTANDRFVPQAIIAESAVEATESQRLQEKSTLDRLEASGETNGRESPGST